MHAVFDFPFPISCDRNIDRQAHGFEASLLAARHEFTGEFSVPQDIDLEHLRRAGDFRDLSDFNKLMVE